MASRDAEDGDRIGHNRPLPSDRAEDYDIVNGEWQASALNDRPAYPIIIERPHIKGKDRWKFKPPTGDDGLGVRNGVDCVAPVEHTYTTYITRYGDRRPRTDSQGKYQNSTREIGVEDVPQPIVDLLGEKNIDIVHSVTTPYWTPEQLVNHGCTPAEALDYHMVENRGYTQEDWASERDLSGHQAVGENIRKAREKIPTTSPPR